MSKFPVIITASTSNELLAQFLAESAQGALAELAPNYVPNRDLVVLTTDNWSQYDRADLGLTADAKPGNPEPVLPKNFVSPFIGHSPLQVARTLREEATFPRDNVSIEFCAILDQQTVADQETVLLVRTRRAEGENLPEELEDAEIVQLRCPWADVEVNLLAWEGGEGSMEERVYNDYEEARP